MTELIYHLALVSEWEAAKVAGDYRISTLGRTLDEEGFLHFCRTEEQLAGVAQRYYAHVADPLCLLTVDVARLPMPVVDEPPAPAAEEPGAATTRGLEDASAGSGRSTEEHDRIERFPHLYGPLPVEAVVAVTPLGRDHDGRGVAAATVDAYRSVTG